MTKDNILKKFNNYYEFVLDQEQKALWLKRVHSYVTAITNNNLQNTDILQMLKDIAQGYDDEQFTTFQELKILVHIAKPQLAQYFNCKVDEIVIGDLDFTKINENQICTYKIVVGNADLTNIKEAKNLTYVFGNLDAENAKLTKLPSLKAVYNNAYFNNSKITDLSNLEEIGGYVDFTNSQAIKLPNLKTLHKSANFENSKIKELNSLTYIGDCAYFKNSSITSLDNLEQVGNEQNSLGGNLSLKGSNIKSIKNLKTVYGNLISGTNAVNFDSLETISGYADFSSCDNIKEMPNLQKIKSKLYLNHSSQIIKFPNLKACSQITIVDNTSYYNKIKMQFSVQDCKEYGWINKTPQEIMQK